MERVALLSVHSCPIGTVGKGKTGGMSVHLLHLSKELSKRGVQSDIYTLAHDSIEPSIVELAAGVRLLHINSPGLPIDPRLSLNEQLLAFADNVLQQQELEGIRYCLVHSHYWISGKVGTILAKHWRVPHVVTFHSLGKLKWLAYPETEEHEQREEIEQAVAASADTVIALTPYEKEALVQLYDVFSERVRVVPCGVDIDQFRPIERNQAKEALGYQNQRIVLWVGRVDPIKGVSLLLQAMARLKDNNDLRLVLVGGNPGQDPELTKLVLLARELGIDSMVGFVGAVLHERLNIYYNAADVFVFPSYQETFGLVLLEAMACGTPVIAGKAGGPEYIVQDGITGYLVSEQSPELYAQRLKTLLEDDELRYHMGQAARTFAEGLTWSVMAHKLLNLYRELNEPCLAGV